jgi:hypothetical protein
MTPLAQNLAVLLVVGGCVAYVGWQMLQAFRGRKSKLGSCCAKGCGVAEKNTTTPPKPAPEQFLPLANVGRRATTKKSTA